MSTVGAAVKLTNEQKATNYFHRLQAKEKLSQLEKELNPNAKKRKRRSYKKKYKKRYRKRARQNTYNARGGVVMTPYGTLSGLGGYETWGRDTGAAIGGAIGQWGQNRFRALTGFGEYNVTRNSLLAEGTDPPEIINSSGHCTIIRHREYVGDLLSGDIPVGGSVTDFDLNKWTIQPGNPALFPWLSTIADNYQEWEARGIIVELKTLTSDFSDKSVLGSMFCGTQYNVLEADPSSKRHLENLQYSTSSKPSESIIHAIECSASLNAQTHLYVAQDGVVKTGDSRLYDLGNLYLGSQGIPVEHAPIAEIWVSYEIALYKPQLGVPLLATWQWRDYNNSLDSIFGLPAGTYLKPDLNSYSGVTVQVGVANDDEFTIRFPDLDGEWDIFLYDVSTSGTSTKGLLTFTVDPGVSLVQFITTNPITPAAWTTFTNDWQQVQQDHMMYGRVQIKSLDVIDDSPGVTIRAGGVSWGGAHCHTMIINRVNPEVYDGLNY